MNKLFSNTCRIAASLILASIMIAIPARAQLASSPWPMFHHDLSHTGLSQFDTSTNPGALHWRFLSSAAVGNPVIGADGTLYVGCGEGLCAVNSDGSRQWSFAVSGSVTDTPAIGAGGTIYVGGSSTFYAINPNGVAQSSMNLSTGGYTSPAIAADATIYIGDQDKLLAISPQGVVTDTLLNAITSPAVGGGSIYAGACSIGSSGYSLGSFQAGSLTSNWQALLTNGCSEGFTSSSAAIGSGGTLYVGSIDGNLYAVNSDGSLKWQFTNGGFVQSSPSIGPDGTIYIGSSDGHLYALTDGGPATVTQKWSFPTGGAVSDPAVGSDGAVYIGSADKSLYAVKTDGSQKWSFPTGGTVGDPAIGSDGTVYAGSADGNLYAVGVAGTGPTPTAVPTPAPVEVKLDIAPKNLEFPKTEIGETSKPKDVEVSNPKGTKKHPGVTVQIEMISAPGVFSETNTCPPSLAAGAKCTIAVTFTPNALARQTGALTITDNAEHSSQTVGLTGAGKEGKQTAGRRGEGSP